MITFRRRTQAVDNFGVRHFCFEADGLPDGADCYYAPDEAARPRGSWFVVVKKSGRRRVLHCDSKTSAAETAREWCEKVCAATGKAGK